MIDSTLKKKSANVFYKGFGEFFSTPIISAMCQANPISAGLSSYIGGSYQQEQFKTLEKFIFLLDEKVKKIEAKNIDRDFIQSPDGQRIISKVFRAIISDNRKEKLEAMANLTSNVYTIFSVSNLTIDEKELYVGILDGLNALQLSILDRAMKEIKSRSGDQHRGFGWEEFGDHYEKKGITRALLLQSIRVLESNGLINTNTATIVEKDKTHFVTFFGEQFYAFISDVISQTTKVRTNTKD